MAAKTFLEQAATSNLPEFLKALSEVLVQITNSSVARTAAGLQLKNHLTSKDATLSLQYQQRWLSIPEDIREYIKKNVRNYLFRLIYATDANFYTNLISIPNRYWHHWVRKILVHHRQHSVLRMWPLLSCRLANGIT